MDTGAGTGEAESCRSAVVHGNPESDCKGRKGHARISFNPQPLLSSIGAISGEAALVVWATWMHLWCASALVGSVPVRKHRARAGHQPLWYFLWFASTSPAALRSGRHCRSQQLPTGIERGGPKKALSPAPGVALAVLCAQQGAFSIPLTLLVGIRQAGAVASFSSTHRLQS